MIERLLFADSEFSLEKEDVDKARKRALDNAEHTKQMLNSANTASRQYAQEHIEAAKRAAAFFMEKDDDTILEVARIIYEEGRALEAEGNKAHEVAEQIGGRHPEMRIIHHVLEASPWGEELVHTAFALGAVSQDTK